MVQIFKATKGNRTNKSRANQKLKVKIDSLDHEGTGVCRQHSPVIFVQGGLPGEVCQIQVTEQKSRYWRASVKQVVTAASQRIEAFCQYYQRCGGCNNQQISAGDLLTHKQAALSELLKRVGQQDTLPWVEPITSEAKGYRRKARLAVDAQSKGKTKLGFRSAQGRQILNIEHCAVLTPVLQELLLELNQHMDKLSKAAHIGHAVLLDVLPQPAVILRLVKPLPNNDIQCLKQLCMDKGCRLLVEKQKGEFQTLLGHSELSFYQLDNNLKLSFLPNDFIQGNERVNAAMVTQAIQWLALEPGDEVLDLFCGIGNFSLPLAQHCQTVLGIEGVDEMVSRATTNARQNGINNARFLQMDLNQENSLAVKQIKACNKVLLDPARAGALEVMPQLLKLKPQAILYISCNPATFARDAAVLTEKNYRLDKICLLDMFPATSHTELMALFLPVADK